MKPILCVNAGIIPLEQTAINQLASWANDMERKLLCLHCGQSLPRDRHLAWAQSKINDCLFMKTPRKGVFLLIVPMGTRGE